MLKAVTLLLMVSSSFIHDAIIRELAHEPPQYVLNLGAAAGTPDVKDLIRTGIISPVSTFDTCGGTRTSYFLNETGQRVGGALGWVYSADVLIVPLGRWSLKKQKVARLTNGVEEVSFQYSVQLNANAKMLLSLGKASDWGMGGGLTLADAAHRTFTRVIRFKGNGAIATPVVSPPLAGPC